MERDATGERRSRALGEVRVGLCARRRAPPRHVTCGGWALGHPPVWDRTGQVSSVCRGQKAYVSHGSGREKEFKETRDEKGGDSRDGG